MGMCVCGMSVRARVCVVHAQYMLLSYGRGLPESLRASQRVVTGGNECMSENQRKMTFQRYAGSTPSF